MNRVHKFLQKFRIRFLIWSLYLTVPIKLWNFKLFRLNSSIFFWILFAIANLIFYKAYKVVAPKKLQYKFFGYDWRNSCQIQQVFQPEICLNFADNYTHFLLPQAILLGWSITISLTQKTRLFSRNRDIVKKIKGG